MNNGMFSFTGPLSMNNPVSPTNPNGLLNPLNANSPLSPLNLANQRPVEFTGDEPVWVAIVVLGLLAVCVLMTVAIVVWFVRDGIRHRREMREWHLRMQGGPLPVPAQASRPWWKGLSIQRAG